MKQGNERKLFIDFMAAIGQMVLFFDANGNVFYANRVANEELGLNDNQGSDEQNLFSKENQIISMEKIIPAHNDEKIDIYAFAKTHKEESLDMVVYRTNGTCFPAEVRFSLWEEECGYCVICNESQLAELKQDMLRAEKEIKELRDMRNDFVANVTHELRTPLNGFKGHLAKLIDMEEKTKQQNDIYQIMHRCSINMENIINNILDFNKLQSGKFQLEEREFSLADVMQQVYETSESRANDNGILFSVEVDEDIPDTLYGDSMHLLQIMNNLVSNAIKFTENGFVKVKVVKVFQLGKKVELFFLVVDSGIGISAEEKDKIFESFVQADASITRRFGGTGLGLSITKDLVQMMGGTINVDSEKGKGSTFSFSLVLQNPNGDDVKEEATHRDARGIISQVEREREEAEQIYIIGTPENKAQLRSNMEKLVICIEMENWAKAERFATMVKKLLVNGEDDWKKQAFRLEMSVRKENYEKCITLYDALKESIKELIDSNL